MGVGFACCIGDYGHFVDQDLQRVWPQVGAQRLRLTAAQSMPAIGLAALKPVRTRRASPQGHPPRWRQVPSCGSETLASLASYDRTIPGPA